MMSLELAMELTVEPRGKSEVASVFCGFVENISTVEDPHYPDITHQVLWDKYGVEFTWVQIPHLGLRHYMDDEETDASLLEHWGSGSRLCTPVYVETAREATGNLIDFHSDRGEEQGGAIRDTAMFVGKDAVSAAFSTIADTLEIYSTSPRLQAMYNAIVLAVNRVGRGARGADASSLQLSNMRERLRREKELLAPNLSEDDEKFLNRAREDAVRDLEWGIQTEHPLLHTLIQIAGTK